MSKNLKNEWKQTGVSLGHAFRDLAKTVVKSASVAVDKAENWANDENKPQNANEVKNEQKTGQ